MRFYVLHTGQHNMVKYMDIDMVSSSDELAELQENRRIELKEKRHDQYLAQKQIVPSHNPLEGMAIGTFSKWHNDRVTAHHTKTSKVDRLSIQYLEQYE